MEKKRKIVIVGDNLRLAKSLGLFLLSKGFSIRLCETQLQIEEAFKQEDFHLCLLSYAMQKNENIALKIRRYDKHIPIVFMLDRLMEKQELEDLQLTDIDFIVKPFSMGEIVKKIQAAFDTSLKKRGDEEIFAIGSFIFDANRKLLIGKKKKTIQLTTKESELLRFLCKKMGNVADRASILEKVWKTNDSANARTIDVYINKLRKYLSADDSIVIENIYGEGYKLSVN